MRLLYVMGARPNFVKMAPVIFEMRRRLPDAEHTLVHTGQHYDEEMSRLFFEQLDIPEPKYYLRVGSGSHAAQTARAMEALERVVVAERPDLAFVPGDVNSTLAAALVLAKVNVPYAHVESGLRSFDRTMPEEINRIVADEFASILFAHSDEAVDNLKSEGIDGQRVHLVGNTMIDTLVKFEAQFRTLRTARSLGLKRHEYLLVTLHRPSLVDTPILQGALDALGRLASEIDVVFPVHPRTRAALDERRTPKIRFVPPVGYLDFLSLTCDAAAVLTDSGGVQEETTYLGIPCFTLRDSTERPVTSRLGTNTVLGLNPTAVESLSERIGSARRVTPRIPLWDGKASKRIADVVETYLSVLSQRGARSSRS